MSQVFSSVVGDVRHLIGHNHLPNHYKDDTSISVHDIALSIKLIIANLLHVIVTLRRFVRSIGPSPSSCLLAFSGGRSHGLGPEDPAGHWYGYKLT